jgi:hypothetical protein
MVGEQDRGSISRLLTLDYQDGDVRRGEQLGEAVERPAVVALPALPVPARGAAAQPAPAQRQEGLAGSTVGPASLLDADHVAGEEPSACL